MGNFLNKLNYKLKAVLLFALTFTLGFSVYYGYFQQSFYERDPAAIGKKVHQLKNFDPEQLKEELINKIQIQNLPTGEKFIRFASLSSNVCKQYQNVQVQFVADGISVGGEAPVMTIDAQCLPAQDPLEMASIQVPVEKILKQKPANATYKFDGLTSTFTFSSSGDEWPRTWILKSITFKNANGNTKIIAFDRTVAPETKPTVLEF